MSFLEDRTEMSSQVLLYRAMLEHPTVTQYIGDDEFCKELYGSLCNSLMHLDIDKMNITDEEREEFFANVLKYGWTHRDATDCGMGFRAAGGFVAELRNALIGTSEDYLDWYCSGPEGYCSPRLYELYEELGIQWKEWTDD